MLAKTLHQRKQLVSRTTLKRKDSYGFLQMDDQLDIL